MKKILWLVFLFLVIPFGIKAFGITDYKINATVLNNGDLLVQEAFKLDGEYNGFERIINFKNNNTRVFDGSEASFNGSDIYNATGIILKQIRALPYGNYNFEIMKNSGDKFTKVSLATNGDYGVYKENLNTFGNSYLIYNPSSSGKFFYIEYVITNLAVVHNDVAEIGWNIFTDLNEDVQNLEVTVNIPNNASELRVWAHGPLTGNIEIKNKNKFVLTLNGLYANEDVDTRFVFDKNIINSMKTTKVNALDKIIKVETEKAIKANQEREALEKKLMLQKLIVISVSAIYLLILVALLIKFYLKYDRELKSDFNQKYFRDIPSNYPPTTVGYLFNKKISSNDLSATILALINEHVISIEGNNKNNYKFIYKNKEANLTESQKKLIELVFDGKEAILLEDFKKNAKKNYSSFLAKYDSWKRMVTKEAINENFYEKRKIGWYIIYIILGVILGYFMLSWSFLSVICIIASILSLIYIISSNKKTKKGNDDFVKWKALKNFMQDFSIIDKRQLPEVNLWGQYLVYAVSLGCADKLAKDMAIRVKEFNDVHYNSTLYNPSDIVMLNNFNHIINDSVISAINSARTAESVANSSISSGSGFGGGFSGGGGSFGGGGGGGRF